jgi:hypothetical protein
VDRLQPSDHSASCTQLPSRMGVATGLQRRTERKSRCGSGGRESRATQRDQLDVQLWSFPTSLLHSLHPTVAETIDPITGARAFGIPRVEASRDDGSDGAHALLPADISSSTVQLGARHLPANTPSPGPTEKGAMWRPTAGGTSSTSLDIALGTSTGCRADQLAAARTIKAPIHELCHARQRGS